MKISDISRALVIWTGRESSPWPIRDDEAVLAAFGPEQGAELLDKLRELETQFYDTKANFAKGGIARIGEIAAADFRALHPDVDELVIEILVWCYTYDFR